MTTLYKKKEEGSNWTYIGMEEATLSDLKAALESHGMVACPRPNEHYVFIENERGFSQVSKALSSIDADSYKRSLEHKNPGLTYCIMVKEG